MKTKQLIMAALLSGPLFIGSSFGQGLYLGVGGGMHFPAARQSTNMDVKSTTSGTVTTTEYSSRSMSYGKGINAGLYIGYMFNKNIGAELGLGYLMGGKTVITDDFTGATFTNKVENTYSASMLRIVPTIRMTAGEGNLRPYMKTGLIVGMGAKATRDESDALSGTVASLEENSWEYSGGMSLGFHSALGLTFMISDGLGIFAEVAGNFQNWAPKTRSWTKSVDDGVDELATETTRSKEVEYVDNYTTISGEAINQGEPTKQSRIYLPFSSIGINIGVHFTLGGGGSSDAK